MPAVTASVTLRIPPELLEVIDSCRGGISRNEWMVTALQWAYANRGAVERALGDAEQQSVALSPAEQPEAFEKRWSLDEEHKAIYRQHVPGPNVENIRSSEQAREFRPYPKGGKR